MRLLSPVLPLLPLLRFAVSRGTAAVLPLLVACPLNTNEHSHSPSFPHVPGVVKLRYIPVSCFTYIISLNPRDSSMWQVLISFHIACRRTEAWRRKAVYPE